MFSTVRKVCLQSGMYISRDDDFNRLVVNHYNNYYCIINTYKVREHVKL